MSGLLPIKRRDIRNFNHELQFGAADLSKLPRKGLGRKPISIKNQRNTQFCPGYSTATASEYIEGIEMSPEYQAALVGEIAGAPILQGASFKNAIKALTLFGSLPQKDAPFTLDQNGELFVADINNWPASLKQKADDHLKASAYDVDEGSYDAFDNIRSALDKAKEQGEDRVVLAATQWFSNWNGGVHRKGRGSYTWHLHCIIDWTEKDGEIVLIGQNSYGKDWGDNGLNYWSREAINQLAADRRNEFKMVRDLTPETAKERQWGIALHAYDRLVKLDPTGAFKWLIEIVADLLKKPTLPPTLPPVAEPSNQEKLLALAEAHKNKDVSLADPVDDAVACVDSLTDIVRKLYPNFPKLYYTPTLLGELKKSPHFVSTTTWEPGCVVVNATGTGNGSIRGHCGIVGKDKRVWSNNSTNGLWTTYYTVQAWKARYELKGGFKTHIFKPI